MSKYLRMSKKLRSAQILRAIVLTIKGLTLKMNDKLAISSAQIKHQGRFSGGMYSDRRLRLPSFVATPEIEGRQRPVVSQKSIETAICQVPAVAIR